MSRDADRDGYIRTAEELLDEKSDRLTKWEEDFLRSILNQMGDGGFLTPRQIDKLAAIYAEKK